MSIGDRASTWTSRQCWETGRIRCHLLQKFRGPVRNFHTPVPNFRGPPPNIQLLAEILEAGLEICYRATDFYILYQGVKYWKPAGSNSSASPRNIQTEVPIQPKNQLVPARLLLVIQKLRLFTKIIFLNWACLFVLLFILFNTSLISFTVLNRG